MQHYQRNVTMKPISEVYNIDCLEFLREQPDKSFDLAIVDPPYELPARSTHGRGKLKNRILNKGNIQQWDIKPPKEYFDELFRVSKNQIIWGGNYFDLPPTRCVCVWDKIQPWENFSQVEIAWTSFDLPAKLFSFDNKSWSKHHPTGKPVELYSWLLKTFAKEGNRILDTHLGGGTSRVAAYMLGYDFFGCEINPEYFKSAEEYFRMECLGEYTLKNGRKVKQLDLFG